MVGTRAEGVLDPDFHRYYQEALHGQGTGGGHVRASEVFESAAQARMRHAVSSQALETPVVFSDHLPDDTLGIAIPFEHSPNGYAILLNSRVHVDPEQLAHTAAEEVIHVERALRGRENDYAPAYGDQAHEQSARRGSRYVTGFDRPNAYGHILRDHPDAAGSAQAGAGSAGHLSVPQSLLEVAMGVNLSRRLKP